MTQNNSTKPPLLIIAGPTASGKSDAAVALAKRMNGAVISADSMQVYRHMDIGSAKIRKDEMQGIDHYLLDCVDPTEEWNVVRFQQLAREAAAKITREGKLPILCGGTGFYIQALLYDIDFTPTSEDTGCREKLAQIAQEQGTEALHQMLAQRDPEAAKAIHPNNVKRVIRALEFLEHSGSRISEHNEKERSRESAYRSAYIVLTMDRARLYRRIDERVDRMIERGLVGEVRALRAMGLTSQDVSMQGLGYRQILDHLDGRYDLEEAVRIIKRDTRHFAKRQLTWFRREKDVIWVDLDRFETREALWDELYDIAVKKLTVTEE